MSVNRYQPHIFILPEDDANRQLAIGFVLKTSSSQIRILGAARGWSRVRELFVSDHIVEMKQFGQRIMVLLLDFDGQFPARFDDVRSVIPDNLIDRVFILGVWTEPEDLRRSVLGSFEHIGQRIADDCRAESVSILAHDLLRHNETELDRLRKIVGDWLFKL